MKRASIAVTVVVSVVWGCGGAPTDGDAGMVGRDAARADAAGPGDASVLDASSDALARADVGQDAGVARIDALVAVLDRGDEREIDAALHDVAWTEGWPLHEADRWLFATRLEDRPAAAALVGHINGWSPTRHPASRARSGVHFWVVVPDGDLEVPADQSKYKWYLPSDGSFRPPLEATQYGFDDFGRFGWVRAPRDAAHLEQFPAFQSAHLEAPRAFRAYLPAGFVPHSAEASRTRTLLMHDGQNLFHPDAFFGGWRVDATLGVRGRDVVVVAVDNAPDRMDAYTHTTDDIGAGRPVGGRAEDYLALLAGEALPFFRARYGVIARGRSLMMSGSSLGGLVTLLAAQRDFEDMGCGAALSSTVGWGSIAAAAGGERTILRTWSGLHAPLYLDSGGGVTGACVDRDGDGIEDDGDDRDNYCVNLQMRGVLEASGYVQGRSLTYAWAPGAPHNEAAWAARFASALDACETMGWSAP